mmetsp:Transcript_20477/g.33958  ORF Transcript_20477/g.33958 Transcript_20477/m.33958 type:complete len:208 (+) Transcript_20477:254-877(+)
MSQFHTRPSIFGRNVFNWNAFQHGFKDILLAPYDTDLFQSDFIDEALDHVPDHFKPRWDIDNNDIARPFGIMIAGKGTAFARKVHDFARKIRHAHSVQINDGNTPLPVIGFQILPSKVGHHGIMPQEGIEIDAGVSHGAQIDFGRSFVPNGFVVATAQMKELRIMLFDEHEMGMRCANNRIHTIFLPPCQGLFVPALAFDGIVLAGS